MCVLASASVAAPGAAQRVGDARIGFDRESYRSVVLLSPAQPSVKRRTTGAIVGAVVVGLVFGIGAARGCENECKAATTLALALGIPLGALLGFVVADVTDR